MSRQVGQAEIRIHQDEDEVMNQLVVGAFFIHPDEGLSICKDWIQVCKESLCYRTPASVRYNTTITVSASVRNRNATKELKREKND